MATLVSNQLNESSHQSDIRQEIASQIPKPIELPECVVVPEKTVPPINYDNQVFQNNLNDGFDQKYLLKRIPKRNQPQAENLLKTLSERANELTWDSSGIIYVDGRSVPNSDIFRIFPSLFKKQHPKRIKGFEEFIEKLSLMGLSHFLPIKQSQIISKSKSGVTEGEVNSQWWYIGE